MKPINSFFARAGQFRLAWASACAIALAGCGGGSEPTADSEAQRFVSQMPTVSAEARNQTLATKLSVTNRANPTAVLDWAEFSFPELFRHRLQSWDAIEYNGQIYLARVYASPAGLRYLGITPDGRIFGLGDFTSNALVQFETVDHWSPQVCAVLPASCATVSGKLLPEIRLNGLSNLYATSPTYASLVDAVVGGMAEIAVDLNSSVGWPVDIPVMFTGCGNVNAFMASFAAPTSMWSALRPSPSAPGGDFSAVFGPDKVVRNVAVMCHELTEKAFQVFFDFNDPVLLGEYAHYFLSTNAAEQAQELYAAATFATTLFGVQVLMHEVGHGVDFLLLKDGIPPVKKAAPNFAYPISNICSSSGCDTVAEDFADWFSAFTVAEQAKLDLASATPTEARWYVGALRIATLKWDSVLGAGGAVSHGFTLGRQLNMVCYVYGSSAELRTADANTGGKLLDLLGHYSLTADYCTQVYAYNAAATRRLLGASVRY